MTVWVFVVLALAQGGTMRAQYIPAGRFVLPTKRDCEAVRAMVEWWSAQAGETGYLQIRECHPQTKAPLASQAEGR